LDLTALYLLVLPAVLYLRAVRVLAARGFDVPNLQRACWFSGLALIGIALLSPLDNLGETDLLSAHMGQHLLIADLSAPLLVIGARWPVYAFLLPRPVMVPLARWTPLRRLLRTLTLPWVAAPVWVLTLYSWHFAAVYDAALRNPFLHALQHQAFIAASVLLWIAVLEPTKRRVPGALWKIAHVGGARLAGMFLGMAFIFARHPLYEDFYGQRALKHGITPLTDQAIAGGMMLGLDFLTMMGALLFFFWRSAEDAEREERREAVAVAQALAVAEAAPQAGPVRSSEVKLG
jgi:cytochrome c oxidase assembly factor CtaG